MKVGQGGWSGETCASLQVTTTDVDLLFTSKSTKKKMDFTQFKEALTTLAGKRKLEFDALEAIILGSKGPSSSGTKVERRSHPPA